MNPRVILVLNLFLFACNAYRTSPESVILFTKQDLSKRGFVISPLVDLSPGNTTSVSEENAFDTILSNTLSEEWKNVKLLPTVAVIQMLDGEQLELWRDALKKEDAAQSSPSTLKILKKLDALGKSHPSQVLLPSILQNSLSCGRKEALSTYLNPDPRGSKAYCQRVMKMRFRILDVETSALLWNGIIYATQESTAAAPQQASDAAPPLDPPSTQALIRECFNNFAQQFADK